MHVPRTAECLDGLAILGHGTVASVPVAPPALLEIIPPAGTFAGLTLSHRDGPSGTRHIVLASPDAAVELDFPVLAPEISSGEPGVYRVAERAFLLHFPFARDALAALRSEHAELLVLGNARTLWNEGPSFVAAVREVRATLGAGPLLWAPRVALPHRVPFLVYVGVDLVDTTEGELRSAQGRTLDLSLGETDRREVLAEHACDCPACTTEPPGPVADHNRIAYRRSVGEVRAALRQGRLRELVESRLVAEPALAELLRYVDRELAGPLEERTPVTRSASRYYVLAEAHRRPEMVRFRARLKERYRPPPSKSVLLLVPCSKTKPYRRSRSHRRFSAALEGLRALERVHVVSVSSPAGLVPRELEDLYPVRHYDIPVTGDWTEAERATVVAGLDHLRRTGSYRSVVVHLDPHEYSFLEDPLPPGKAARWTISDEHTTSAAALRALRDAVAEALAEETSVAGGPLSVVREELQQLASFQFGPAAAAELFAPPIRLAGRPWFQRVTDGKTDLATVREERGLFHLTVAGARRLKPPFPLAVEVDPVLPLTGDLFVPGVRDADPSIRIGDSVILLRNGELAAVGEATLPGPLMTQLARGLAVKVRHREHRATDTPMTEKGSSRDEGPVV